MQLTLWSVQGAVRRVEYAMFSVAYLCLVVVSSGQWKVTERTCFLFYYFTVIFKRWLPNKLYFQQETSDHFYWLVLTMGKRTTIYLAFETVNLTKNNRYKYSKSDVWITGNLAWLSYQVKFEKNPILMSIARKN